MNKINNRKNIIWGIVCYSVIVIVLAFLGPLIGGSPYSMGPGFLLWGAAPLLSATIIRVISRDWNDAGLKLRFRKNKIVYLLAVLSSPVTMGITIAVCTAFSLYTFMNFSFAKYFGMVLPGLGMFFVFAIFEEFGWRGYLGTKLSLLGMNDYVSYAVVAVIWGTWHMPFIRDLSRVYAGSEGLLTLIPRFYLSCFAYAILYGELKAASGSVWPAVIVHSVTNAIQHPLMAEFIKIDIGLEYLASFNGLIIIVLVGSLGIMINIFRKKESMDISKG